MQWTQTKMGPYLGWIANLFNWGSSIAHSGMNSRTQFHTFTRRPRAFRPEFILGIKSPGMSQAIRSDWPARQTYQVVDNDTNEVQRNLSTGPQLRNTLNPPEAYVPHSKERDAIPLEFSNGIPNTDRPVKSQNHVMVLPKLKWGYISYPYSIFSIRIHQLRIHLLIQEPIFIPLPQYPELSNSS